MTCPTCGSALSPGHARCASCGEGVAPPIEGALAADPRRITPPARGRGPDTLREIPGLRRRESTWKDEVRERVRNRREQRSASPELPLFPDGGMLRRTHSNPRPSESGSPPPLLPDGHHAGPSPAEDASRTARAPSAPVLPTRSPAFDEEVLLAGGAGGPGELGDEAAELLLRPEQDLEMRAAEPASDLLGMAGSKPDVGGQVLGSYPPSSPRDDPGPEEWSLSDTAEPVAAPESVERPATLGERFQAGAIDAGFLIPLWAVVIYFASCAARVSMMGLLPAWPSLAGYLAFLGLAYAGYFTGTTGQTLGKIVVGLRVVDSRGQPPGYFRAFVRAAAGVAGVLAAALGFVSTFFDPLRRALHDRLMGTRVVKN